MSTRDVRSPAVGRVIEVLVRPGDAVTAGQEVAVVESMKVEIPVVAESAGVVERIAVDAGAQVQSGGLLLILSS